MKWDKQGLIIKPSGEYPWMVSHAMLPIPEWRHDDVFRIYFSGRDANNRSLTGYAEIDLNCPHQILNMSKQEILGLGDLGCFDDSGVTPSWIVNNGGKKYLYYVGWNRRSTVRMAEVAGLAVSEDNGESFERVFKVPILDRTNDEPLTLNAATCVLFDQGRWRMWYVSGLEWVHADLPRYRIKYAESEDGQTWHRPGIVCIDFASESEHGLARPCVLFEDGIYKMWYSYKGLNYRIGYAESADGIIWTRLDHEVGIDVSSSGWDSEMIEYAYVFNHKGRKYMLYNGNNYGYDGIGLAVSV